MNLDFLFTSLSFFLLFKKISFIYFQREGKGGRKRQRETTCGCLSCTPNWGPGLQPSLCSDWEAKWWPFGSQAGTQSTEPHQTGLFAFLFNNYFLKGKWVMLAFWLIFSSLCFPGPFTMYAIQLAAQFSWLFIYFERKRWQQQKITMH